MGDERLLITTTQVAESLDLVGKIVPLKAWIAAAKKVVVATGNKPLMSGFSQDRHGPALSLANIFSYRQTFGEMPSLEDPLFRQGALLASAISYVSTQLSPSGLKRLAGMIKDGLKSDTGLWPLYLELATAVHLEALGWNLSFEDLEGRSAGADGTSCFDFLGRKSGIEIEVECKHVSGDFGQKIHQRDFIALSTQLVPLLKTLSGPMSGHLLDICLDDRLPDSAAEHLELVEASRTAIASNVIVRAASAVVEYRKFDATTYFQEGLDNDTERQSAVALVLRDLLGHENPMAIGFVSRDKAFVIASVRSKAPSKMLDDLLSYLKRMTKRQFTGDRPGFLYVRLGDLSQNDLLDLARLNTTDRRKASQLQLMASSLIHERPVIHTLTFLSREEIVKGDAGYSNSGRSYCFPNSSHPQATLPVLRHAATESGEEE